jgi:hypothetical protein
MTRAIRLIPAVATGLALTLFGALPASASSSAESSSSSGAASASTTSTWTLWDAGQRICLRPNEGWPAGAYFLVPLHGTWTTTLTTGLRNLPPGTTSPGGAVQPGSESGGTIHGFVPISIGPLPAGVYTPELWASDGTETQAVPVTLKVSDVC